MTEEILVITGPFPPPPPPPPPPVSLLAAAAAVGDANPIEGNTVEVEVDEGGRIAIGETGLRFSSSAPPVAPVVEEREEADCRMIFGPFPP